MNKRERVITTLELGEPDIIPIHCPGFERSGTAYQIFKNSKGSKELKTKIPEIGDITEWIFWNSDLQTMDPFNKITSKLYPTPKEYPNHKLKWNGSLKKKIIREKTNTEYWWYIGGYFRKKEALLKYWEDYGSPSQRFNEEEDFSAQKWENFCLKLENYFFPMVKLEGNIWEAVFEGMGADGIGYYMRKDPAYVNYVMDDFCNLNLKIIKGLGEAGVEICIMYDDLGQKGRTLLSHDNFRRFVLPQYKKMYQAAKKRGILFIQHSCGNITKFLPDLIDAGLSGIQSLEAASGVNLEYLKRDFGDKIALLGGIDSSATLRFGTNEQIKIHVKKCVESAGKNGGYFIGPSHNIIDAPWENVLTLRDAINYFR